MLKIDRFARKNECTGALLALHANKWLYGAIFHNSRIFLQNINISDRIRFKTAQYCRFVSRFCLDELAYQCMEMLNSEQEEVCWTRGSITSIPTSIAPRLCCRVCAAFQSVSVCLALQIVQSASLHSFKLVLLVSVSHWQSVGIELVTDVPLDRAASVLSTCQELEKGHVE